MIAIAMVLVVQLLGVALAMTAGNSLTVHYRVTASQMVSKRLTQALVLFGTVSTMKEACRTQSSEFRRIKPQIFILS